MAYYLTILIFFLFILYLAGGFHALTQGVDVLMLSFKKFFPVFFPIIEYSINDYLTSPQFYAWVIITLLSIAGFVLTTRKKKIVGSILTSIITLISLIINIGNITSLINK